MKVDFKKSHDCYRAEHRVFRDLEIPPLQYLMVDGHGDPNSTPEWADAIGALYPIAYKIKFASKQQLGRDYVVPPLEALWSAADMSVFTTARDKSRWDWTAMLMVPDWITSDIVDAAIPDGAVRLERLDEGRCVQTLHIGSYDDEADVLAELHDVVIPDAGLRMSGRHHEIYLSDARRVEAARLRTILRQPVVPAST